MNKSIIYKILVWGIFFCSIMSGGYGCTSSNSLWYKPGHSQVDFDLDNRDCSIIAQEMGRQATINGEKIDLKIFSEVYTNCLFSKGWTHTPPGNKKNSRSKPITLAQLKGNRINGFSRYFSLPKGFHLMSNQIAESEDMIIQTLLFQGDKSVVLHITFQQAYSRKFNQIDYPTKEPFFVFEKGSDKTKGGSINWTVFSGESNGNWLAGIGAYYIMDKNKRIGFVLLTNIEPTKESPPKGLRLTKAQKIEVESFSDEWLPKIKTAFGADILQNKSNHKRFFFFAK